MQQIMTEDSAKIDNQRIVEEKLEWIKKKSYLKKNKRVEGSNSLDKMEDKKEEEKAGCAVYVRLRPDNEMERD